MQAVEFEKVRRRFCATFDLVDVRDLKPIAGAWIIARPRQATHGCA